MGGSLMLYFLKWVEAEPDEFGFGGGGGKDWVENNVEAWINIAGTLLGVPKAMTAFMSGEMRDTVELNPMGSYVLEKVGWCCTPDPSCSPAKNAPACSATGRARARCG